MLVLDNVGKIYINPFDSTLKEFALRGISLILEEKQCAFLIGRSGSGKTTLMRLVAGIEEPSAGKIIYNNKDLSKISTHDKILYRRKTLGYIRQNPSTNLLTALTVKENIHFPMKLLNEYSREAQLKKIRDLLLFVGMADKGERKVYQLSGGEQQRIAVLVAIANAPELILADEPTGELDSPNAKIIIDLLTSYKEESGSSVLIATHNYSLLTNNASIFKINKGLLETN